LHHLYQSEHPAVGLFCIFVRLCCIVVGLFCIVVGLFCIVVGLFCIFVGLFCIVVGLFCIFVGLFCIVVGLFCMLVRLFCIVVGLFCISVRLFCTTCKHILERQCPKRSVPPSATTVDREASRVCRDIIVPVKSDISVPMCTPQRYHRRSRGVARL
jgi:hypothetical protein